MGNVTIHGIDMPHDISDVTDARPYQNDICDGFFEIEFMQLVNGNPSITRACVQPILENGIPTGRSTLRLYFDPENVFDVTTFCEDALPDVSGIDYSRCIDGLEPTGHIINPLSKHEYFRGITYDQQLPFVDFDVVMGEDGEYYAMISNGSYFTLGLGNAPKNLPEFTMKTIGELIRFISDGGYIIRRDLMDKRDAFWQQENTPVSPEAAQIQVESTQTGALAIALLLSLIVLAYAGAAGLTAMSGKVKGVIDSVSHKKKE